MLARNYRLRQPADIARVYRRGRYAGGPHFQVKVLVSKYPASRATVVVSKKVAKSAVVRNRIRRRLSAQLEQLWQTVKPGCDIVVSVRLDLAELSPAELAAELKRQLERCGALAVN